MKSLFITVLALLAFAIPQAQAISTSATPNALYLATTNVTASAWVPIVTSSLKAIKGIWIATSAQSSGSAAGDISIGIAAASASAGTEVAQLIIPSNSTTTGVYIPMTASGATRISVESASGGTLSKGEILLNIIYN
jgi:hypothetical protein